MANKIRACGLSLFLAGMVVLFFGGAVFLWLPLYLLFLLYLLSEYYILLGGVFAWLNTLKDLGGLEETRTLRNLIAVDARLVLVFSILGGWILLIHLCDQSVGNPDCWYYSINSGATYIRLLLTGFIIHSIHTLLMYERVVGIKFIKYPPLCHIVKKCIGRLKEVKWYAKNKSCSD